MEPDASKSSSRYSMKYRIIRSIFLIYSWISLGFNMELIGPCLEDLRILLGVNYQSISFALIVRNIGYLSLTLISGYIHDKLGNYTDLLMAISNLFIITPTFFIPWIRNYWLSMVLFLIQGFAQAIHDVGGTALMLRLWSGISNSPVNLLGAGYGTGALIAVLAARNFVKFNPINKNTTNPVNSNDIRLEIPFTIAFTLGIIEIISLLVAQYYELKNIKRLKFQNQEKQLKSNTENEKVENCLKKIYSFIFKETYTNQMFVIKFILSIILFMLTFSVCGLTSVLYSFFITYLTTGPAHFKTQEAFCIQIAFWISFICGRLLASYLSYKINPLIFFSTIVTTNTLVIGIFCIPQVNSLQMAYMPILCLIGLLTGPTIPSVFTLIKYIFVRSSSLLISIFCMSICLGSIASQKLAAYLLDELKPTKEWLTYKQPNSSYIIPYILFIFVLLSLVLLLFILVFHRMFRTKLR